jgi:copper chaperone CopZ
MERITLHIEGMSCGHCLNAVRQALSDRAGIRVESVQMGRAVVSYDAQVTAPSAIESLIADAGYSATAVPV